MTSEVAWGDIDAADFLRLFEQEFRIGMFIWTIEPERIQWSNRMFEMFGLVPGRVEPSFTLLQTLTHEDDRRTPAALRYAISDARLLNREFRAVWPSGEIRWLAVRARTIIGKSGNPEKVIGACIDVTEKKMAVAALELGEKRRKALVEAAGGVGWLARADGAIMDVSNTEAQRARDVMPWGEGWLSWVHPDDRDAALANWQKAVRDKAPYVTEFRAMCPDGTYHWNRASALPLRGNAGEVLEWVGISFDMEEQVEGRGAHADTYELTGAQIRGARGMLNWSVRDLADAANVSPATLRRLEEFDGPALCPDDILRSIGHAFSKGGVEFVRMPHGKPAIRPR